ncbi:zinc finger C2HC domain-containing protein 1C [Anarrhichthys ocellatus]|uniref:zinc finger C2HC domain-containing protein 1C n=1 Tax=Anarrhichthys ocellatus TaxID=433405 RepID=UPI0012ED24D2|nr:zinc finger C2HC domain-containing protein 1C [Anarrhichthys ocellatus]XP_031703847.1 zinc finger C2HC domain-containing protein 1C [Anarrhichthys ocellatus]
MSTYTGRRHSDQGQPNTAGKRNADVYTEAQHGVVPGRRADAVNQPFPNKPVSHRRSLQPTKQDAFVPYDLEKNTITKQPRGHSLTLEHHSNGTGKTNEYQDPRTDSGGRQPSGELQMARAIHAKELVLQEKLWRVEEKIRQKIQRDTAALDDQKSEEQRHNREQAERGNYQRESRLSEQQRREPVRRREVKVQESQEEDVKQHMKTQDEEERARGERREIESHKKGHKATHQITVPEQEVSGELNKPRWEKVKEHTGRKERDEKNNGIWEDTGVKSQGGTVKAKERHQNTASVGDTGWKREEKYRERTCEETSDDEQDMPQMSQQKASHEAATKGRNPSGGPRLPPLSHPSHSSRPDLRQEESTDTRHQLLLCKVCNRKFAGERLQKHVQICEKVKQSKRGVFNTYLHRTKGSALEEFLKTNSGGPEVLKKNNQRQNQGHTRNLQKSRKVPGGTAHQPK